MGIKVAFVTGPEESVGIKYLSAVLKKHGHQTDLFIDPQLFNDEVMSIRSLSRMYDFKTSVINDLLKYNPDLICFSVLTDFFDWASDLASKIKKSTHVPIIFGGIHPTSVPMEVLKLDAVDIICVGEGEYPLLELANSIANGSRRLNIQNLWMKNKGEIIKNPLRPLVDVNELPYSDQEIYAKQNKYFNIGYHTVASRGCIYRCTYCCHSVLKSLYKDKTYYRIRDVNNLIEEIKLNLKKYNFKIVRFYDDIFPNEQEWLEQFSELYKREIGLPFICYLHHFFVNDRTIAKLKNAGCCEIRLGVQSLNENVRRKIMNRFETNERIKKSFDIIKTYNIKIVTENIIGLPGQNKSDILNMVEFYLENKPNRNHFFWLRYYPGLEINKFREDCINESDIRVKYNSRVFTQGGDVYKKIDKTLILLLYSTSLLPRSIIKFFMKYYTRLYFPLTPLFVFNILNNLKSRSLSDKITRTRTIERYKHYLIKYVLDRLKWQ